MPALNRSVRPAMRCPRASSGAAPGDLPLPAPAARPIADRVQVRATGLHARLADRTRPVANRESRRAGAATTSDESCPGSPGRPRAAFAACTRTVVDRCDRHAPPAGHPDRLTFLPDACP